MKVYKDTMVYLFGEIASKLIPFLMLPYLTRTLGTEGFGYYSYYQGYLILGAVLMGMSQGGAITRYYYFYGNRTIGIPVISGAVISVAISSVVIICCLFLNELLLAIILSVATTQELIVAQLSLRQCQKKSAEYVGINLSVGILGAFLTILFFSAFGDEYIYVFLATLFGNIFVLTFLLFKVAGFKCKINKRKLSLGIRYVFFLGVPLIPHQISIFAKGQADKFFIYNFFGPDSLGVYSAAFQVSSVLSVIIIALNKATLPYFYEGLKSGKLSKSIMLNYSYATLLLPFVVFICSILVPETIFLFILGDGFGGAKEFFSIFSAGITLMVPYLIVVNYLFYYGKMKVISFATIIGTIFYVLYLYFASQISIKAVSIGSALYQVIPIFIFIFYIRRNNSEIK